MSKRDEAAKVTELREKLLVTALRAVMPPRVSHEKFTPLSEEERQHIAEEACKLAHAIAVTAIGFETLLAAETSARRTRRKVHKDIIKKNKKAGGEDDDKAALVSVLK